MIRRLAGARIEEVVPGLYSIGLRLGIIPWVHAFVLVDQDPIIFDTGLPGHGAAFLELLAHIGRRTEDVRHIVVTHHHVDHRGSLAALARATGATIYAHPLDAPVIRGDRPQPGPSKDSAVIRLLMRMGARRGYDRAEPAEVGVEIGDGQQLPIAGGMLVIHTPGHTAGHCSFLVPARRLLIAGDAGGSLFGRVGPPLGVFTEDMGQARSSIGKLAGFDFDTAVFGHGPAIKGKALAAFRRASEKLSRP